MRVDIAPRPRWMPNAQGGHPAIAITANAPGCKLIPSSIHLEYSLPQAAGAVSSLLVCLVIYDSR